MNNKIYNINKNEIKESVEWMLVSNLSPSISDMKILSKVSNLIILEMDDTEYKVVDGVAFKSIYKVKIDFNHEDIDFGVVRNHISAIEIQNNCSICIDVTNLAIPIYTYIIAYFYEIKGVTSLKILYHEAKEYKYPYIHHEGYLKPVEMECFSKEGSSLNELIIFFIGFEGSVTKVIDIEREPNMKVILNGFPSYLLNYKDVSIVENQHLFSNNYEFDYCNASNPFIVYNKINSIYERNKLDYDISIAVCGSTPSVIGAIIFAKDHKDVNIISIKAEEYNFMTRESQNYWVYDVT